MAEFPVRPEDPFDSLRDTFAFAANDWSLSPAEAWAYGIVLGWGEAREEIAARFGWTPDDMARLDRLHDRFAATYAPALDLGPSCNAQGECDDEWCDGHALRAALASEEDHGGWQPEVTLPPETFPPRDRRLR